MNHPPAIEFGNSLRVVINDAEHGGLNIRHLAGCVGVFARHELACFQSHPLEDFKQRTARSNLSGQEMAGTQLHSAAHHKRNGHSETVGINDDLTLIYDGQNPGRALSQQMLIHLSEDRFAQAIIHLHAAVIMWKVIRVVELEERRKANPLEIEIPVRKKARASGPQRSAKPIPAIPVGVQSYSLTTSGIFASGQDLVGDGINKLLVKPLCHTSCRWNVKTQITGQFKVAPDDRARCFDGCELGKAILSQNV